jgi:hypothetical protein
MSVPDPIRKTTAMQVMEEQEARNKAARQAQQTQAAAKQRTTIIPDPARAMEMNSVTKLQELVPIRVATSRVLEGNWSGRELTATRIIGSMYGSKHFIMQLGHLLRVGETDTFRVVFVAHMPVKGDLKDPLLIADAERTAQAFMHMINMQRIAPEPDAPRPLTDEEGRALLTGKRANMLIIDEVSNIVGIPGKPPKR